MKDLTLSLFVDIVDFRHYYFYMIIDIEVLKYYNKSIKNEYSL